MRHFKLRRSSGGAVKRKPVRRSRKTRGGALPSRSTRHSVANKILHVLKAIDDVLPR